jgi:UDP-N-acetylmuramoyl-tripeptide--D-alanyl-D-alanine ligase
MESFFSLFYQSSGVCTDTRNIKPDSLFIALKGANFDGNEFVHQALENGARFAISSREELSDNKSIFFVEDTLLFIQNLGRFHRRKFNIPVIGITGSNGKTTTKELVNAVLSRKFKTLCTTGNLNNHLGVPFTLLELNETHEIAIIEMGANKPGDIQELVDIAEPTCGLITGIGAAHIEGFGSLEGVIKTKSEMYDFLKIQQGLIFYNSNDEILQRQLGNYFNTFTYGVNESAQVQGRLDKMTPYLNFSWKRNDGEFHAVSAKMVGAYNLINYLTAAAVGVHFGVSEAMISEALQSYTPSNNRSQVTETGCNTLIMDAYNANITSMKAALESFDAVEHPNKAVILGDMRELGALSAEAHQEIVDWLSAKSFKKFLVGEEFSKTNAILIEKGFRHFPNTKSLIEHLKSEPIQEHFILVKGSRGIALEGVLEVL